ncbi:FAD-binding molybdopterin dehydrogenase (plasmid) [Azospirillum argentinense]|uniref:FAD-binding molybdopterin dehydrogenase n=1 Tax=Azospirillum argentinense TaxID=2970906 RepID=A0A060DMQ9_9PROT|nr:xanthine dehydrogenase family protein subunit M [Azospirillum argentinense]AIB14035.1 FAD-binding molybdopterin dehydrogenase [Azospirillum argentinense]EZQ05709.1 FAD-binding molybdopterin dehydrogenase [Azospirillum argentinense]
MRSFTYARADSAADAIGRAGASGTAFVAGGTNLLDLMKADVLRPEGLVDISRLPLDRIEETAEGGLRLGALARNADTAYDERVQTRYPMLSKAILAGASAQLRNMATNGGNLLQRTRCYYFYDTATPCNKREPGSGCGAIGGVNRIHAILGASDQCIAVHPSDLCVALAALDAVVQVTGPEGERSIPFAEFHRLPGDHPEIDTTLQPGDLVTAIDLPARGFAEHSTYLKIRDRASYAFALVSVAAGLEMDGGTVREARLALGGVAHKPWRDPEAEAALVGKPATPDQFRAAARVLLRDAKGHEHNSFKIELAERAIVRALTEAAERKGAPRP